MGANAGTKPSDSLCDRGPCTARRAYSQWERTLEQNRQIHRVIEDHVLLDELTVSGSERWNKTVRVTARQEAAQRRSQPALIPVFQLGLFLRALRPARTGLCPARFTSALSELYILKKLKNYLLIFFNRIYKM